MADARFFRAAGPFTLGALASLAEARLIGGDPDAPITDVGAARSRGARSDHLPRQPRYLDQARATRAAACLIRPEHAGRCRRGWRGC